MKDLKSESKVSSKHVVISNCTEYHQVMQMLGNKQQQRLDVKAGFQRAVESCQTSCIVIINQGGNRLSYFLF